MTDLFNFGLALSVAAAPPKVRDEITNRMLARLEENRHLNHEDYVDDREQRERDIEDRSEP